MNVYIHLNIYKICTTARSYKWENEKKYCLKTDDIGLLVL